MSALTVVMLEADRTAMQCILYLVNYNRFNLFCRLLNQQLRILKMCMLSHFDSI